MFGKRRMDHQAQPDAHAHDRGAHEARVAHGRNDRRRFQQKSWMQASGMKRRGMIVPGIVEAVLTGAALWDLYRRPTEGVNGKKWMWAVGSFVQPIGPIMYFVFGRRTAPVGETTAAQPA